MGTRILGREDPVMTPKKSIGIGMEVDPEKVIASACSAPVPCDIVCYSRPGIASVPPGHPRVKLLESADPDAALVADLMAGTIRAAVRGSLLGEKTLTLLEAAAGVSGLERIALLETADGKKFLFAPVGIAEGWTIPEKLALIRKGRVLARRFGLPEKVGVISGGRLTAPGWHPACDRSMAEPSLLHDWAMPGISAYPSKMQSNPADLSLLPTGSREILFSGRLSTLAPDTGMGHLW